MTKSPSPRRSPPAAGRLLREATASAAAGRLDQALETAQRALAVDPALVDAYRLIATIALRTQHPQTALDALHIAVALEPATAGDHCNMSVALRDLGRLAKAQQQLETALRLDPGLASAWFNLGIICADRGNSAEALSCYERALLLAPDHHGAAVNSANILLRLNRPGESARIARQALAASPDAVDLHICLAFALLAQDASAEGWREYEWRWKVPDSERRRHDDRPDWRGNMTSVETLLLYAEQGFGDMIQICRYVSMIRDAARIVLEVPRPLVRLFRTLSPVPGTSLEVVETGHALPPFDEQCPMMSLPLLCGTATFADVPHRIPYLHGTPEEIGRWHERLRHLPGLKVGLCWASAGGTDQASRARAARKSIPRNLLAPLGNVVGCVFISLQKDAGPAAVPPGLMLIDHTSELLDFADTAALIEALDLVITVDTAVAHLAGALGKRVWVLNCFLTDWRWPFDRDASPCYPGARQFRQSSEGAWEPVISRVVEALRLSV